VATRSSPPTTSPGCGIVILNWNNYEDTVRCVDSSLAQRFSGLRIYLVDNGSTDGSRERLLREILDPRVVQIANNDNLGFAAGCNVGIRRAIADGCRFVLLLNNDSVFAHDRVVSDAVAFIEERDQCGVTGGKMMYWSDPSRICHLGGYVSFFGRRRYVGANETDCGQYEVSNHRDFVSGGLMCIRTEVFSRIGVLPEHYFFGWEDLDFCAAARRAGFQVFYDPSLRANHKVHGSHHSDDPVFVCNAMASRVIYMRRNRTTPMFIAWFLAFGLYQTARSALTSPPQHRHAIFTGLRFGWSHRVIRRADLANWRTQFGSAAQ
jgi:GT2 family glycosyltransferase